MRTRVLTLPLLLVLLGAGLIWSERARAYSEATHYFITEKSIRLLPATAPVQAWVDLVKYGSYAEDLGNAEDHVFGYPTTYGQATLPHFWSPDYGMLNLVCSDFLDPSCYPNAWMKASGYGITQPGLWEQAIVLHGVGDRFNGYERLGHICHLLQDMSVPAHVHKDFHIPDGLASDPDPYEVAVSGECIYVLQNLNPAQLNRGLIAIPGAELGKFFTAGGPLGWADRFGLYYLMHTTAERADFFGSDDFWGNYSEPHGWATNFYFELIADVWPLTLQGRGSFTPYASWVVAENYTLVYAVRASATLMALYDNKVYGRIRNTNTLVTYSLIQAAIWEASPNDVIEVAPGTYYESIKFFGKPVHVRSTRGAAQTTIHGNGNAHVVQCVDAEGEGTILEGFTITGGRSLGAWPDNTGGGILTANSSPTIRSCIFTGNTAGSGGGLAAYGTNAPTVVNCLFYANTAANWGGGIYTDGATPILNYCTVSSNQAAVFGGGVASTNVGGTSLTNCIVYDNSAPDSPNFTNSYLAYSCTLPLPTSGTGNITNAPLFRDAANYDFRLALGSPCIDVGLNLGAGVTNDLAGNPRTLDGDGDEVAASDLGALEFNPLTPALTVNTNSNLVGDTSGLSATASTNDLVNAGPGCVPQGSLAQGPLYWPFPSMFFPTGVTCSINNGKAAITNQVTEDGAYLPMTYGGGSLPCTVSFVLNTSSATGGAPNGYQITNINSFAGFHTNSRTLANQKFKVEYRAVGEIGFISLGTFTYAPFATGNDGPSSTLVSISTTGLVLAAHVEEIRLTYQDHGVTPGGIQPTIDGTVLKELDILGFPSLVVSKPSPRQIVQRDASGHANILIEGALGHAFTRVEARAVVMPGPGNTGVSTDWTNVVSTPGSDAFSGTLVGVAEGGWYQIEVRVYDGDLLLDEAVVQRVGVGDIIITAGQSNAGCFGSPTQRPTDDRVSAYNLLTGTWQFAADPQPEIYYPPGMGTGGSPWPILGSMLATNNRVPVGFVGLAYGGSAACQWLPEGCPPLPDLPLYQNLTSALRHFGVQGVRCVLWHQGETDARFGTSAALYELILDTIIAQSRHDAGWPVPWGIAEASYFVPPPPEQTATLACEQAVAAGQRAVIYGNTNVFRGPRTDDFAWELRLAPDAVHFNQAGLDEHADQWFQAIEGSHNDLTLKNGNFESGLPLGDGISWECWGHLSSPAPHGWNLLDATGTTSPGGVGGFYNPDSRFYFGSEDYLPHGGVLPNMSGRQVAFLYHGGMDDNFLQTLPAKLQPSTIYTLTVAIGIRWNSSVLFGGYRVELLTNGQPCSATYGYLNDLNALAGGDATNRFTVVTNTYTSPPTVTPNQQLAVRIAKPYGLPYVTYLDFDNVQVTSQLTPYGEFQSANWPSLNSPDSVPDADRDLDGFSNWDEFIAGTCPISSGSVPRIVQIVLAESEVHVQVQTCAGSIYQLECSHGLPAVPWIAVGPATTGDGTTMTLVDPEPSLASQRFYRVRISR
jgi:hypothetical protein